MPQTAIIREATTNDAAAIASIHVRTWRVAYKDIMPAGFLDALSEEKRRAFWEKELACGQSINRVAVVNGFIVAWASGGASRDPDASTDSEIYAIYVSPDSWSQGIGQQLLKQLEEDIPKGRSITLWVLKENERAIAFYANLGYLPDGASKIIRIEEKDLTEIRLRRCA